MSHLKVKSILILLILILLPAPGMGFTANENASSPFLLQEVISKIENHQRQWTAFKGGISLHFTGENGRQAVCQGEVIYNRLEERLLINCFNQKQTLLFSFKTDDRDFELYLPFQQKIFKGTIFALEESPDIETRLKPIFLYRAFKPLAVIPSRSRFEKAEKDRVSFFVLNTQFREPYVSRRIVSLKSGEVIEETYFQKTRAPIMTIRRENFKKFELKDLKRGKSQILYPLKIQVESHEEPGLLSIEFKNLRFFAFLENESWKVRAPDHTPYISIKDDVQTWRTGQAY